MRIIADSQIPFLNGVLEPYADVVYMDGNEIGPEQVHSAEALLVRTRTRCDEQLLSGSKVRFIGTATIGKDHIDIPWCESQGIAWANAPGCNAQAVCQYVMSALLALSVRHKIPLE
ncbi:MAG TPA: hypothetical protein VLM37_05160, partial [Fibrobacteraceae bacterium]|nr:hypothetical protein [Fibrobacteraceae bacterium]